MKHAMQQESGIDSGRMTVVEIIGYVGRDGFTIVTQGDSQHVHGLAAAARVEERLTDEIVALVDPNAFDRLGLDGPQLIADVHVDTEAGESTKIVLNGDVLREDADPETELEDPTKVL